MKIGPKGILFYGPNVPDICIYGGYITGKDTRFWGINFAYKFQAITILFFAITNTAVAIYNPSFVWKAIFFVVNCFLLALFPFWLAAYVDGVVCNSDGADLDISYCFGVLLYVIVTALFIAVLLKERADYYFSR